MSGPETSNARIRITSNGSSVSDTSVASFTISGSAAADGAEAGGGDGPGSGTALSVTSPNGDESWADGSSVVITWVSTGLNGSVRIELSRDGGKAWVTLSSRTLNDGSYTWGVSGPETSNARARVTSISSPSVSDTSDVSFTIA